MYGPWNDLDSFEVTYTVPLDSRGKVKRRRRRHRHRFVAWNINLPVVWEEDYVDSPAIAVDEKNPKKKKKAPTAADILYGPSGNDQNENQKDDNKPNFKPPVNQDKENLPPDGKKLAPKTPTKVAAAPGGNGGRGGFRRTRVCVAKKGGSGSAGRNVCEVGKNCNKKNKQDTYHTWFLSQFSCEDVEDPEVKHLFRCVEGRDISSLERALGSRDQLVKHLMSVDDYGNTLLSHAIFRGWKTGVKFFIKRKWDLDAVNKYKNSGLHIAVEMGEKKIADYLIKKGASKGGRNEMGLMAYQRLGGDCE